MSLGEGDRLGEKEWLRVSKIGDRNTTGKK